MPSQQDIYTTVTDRIIAELEAGTVPWVRPWVSSASQAPHAVPRNANTGRRYSGINILLLWAALDDQGFPSQSWLTFRQAQTLGGYVRKGERGTTVFYADRFIPHAERQRARETGEEPHAVPFLKRFTVFNVDQCEGLSPDLTALVPPTDLSVILPKVEELIRRTGADFRIGGDRAFYHVPGDFIRVPPPEAYHDTINWHRTALHEAGHWTGAAHRLGRDLSGAFGSATYAAEELVAEMTAAFACAALGIVPTVRHADYIGAWLEVLRADPRVIFRTASAASKAADYLLAFGADDVAGADDA